MDTPRAEQLRPSLATVLADHAAGTWVVLDSDMTRVIASAPTPAEALSKAHIEPSEFERTIGDRPVVIQVPDPNMICLY